MSNESFQTSVLLRDASGEINLHEKTPTNKFSKYNKQYIEGLVEGYIKAIDRLIEKVNLSEDIDKKTKAKVLVLMIGLVIDTEDASEIKKNSKTSGISRIIPNMTELSYVNDIPFDLDVVEYVFKYLSQILKGTGTLEGSEFGDITISGVHFDNLKDFNQVFSTEYVDLKSPVELAQDISYFKKKNNLIRARLFDFVGKGSKIPNEVKIKIRREFKFEIVSQSFQRRKKPIAKKVYDMLADKLLIAYDDLYESIAK